MTMILQVTNSRNEMELTEKQAERTPCSPLVPKSGPLKLKLEELEDRLAPFCDGSVRF